jgi:hypothetical protein
VKRAEVVDLLSALLRRIPGHLLIVWDRLPAHKSAITQQFIAAQGERLWMEYLPGYSAGTEPGRVHLGLPEAARTAECLPERHLVARRRRPANPQKDVSSARLIRAFWQQAEMAF